MLILNRWGISPRFTNHSLIRQNIKAKEVPGLEDLTEVGRLHFRCQFKAGTDEDHQAFVTDNDSRETYETWEACLAEGVREQQVKKELPPKVQELHEASLTEGRDVLKDANDEERQKWLGKDGTDWSGAIGHDPKAYMDSAGRKRAEPGADKPVHDPFDPSDDDGNIPSDAGDDSDSSSDLGIQDADNAGAEHEPNGQAQGRDPNAEESKKREEANKKTEKRKNRGLRQWRPVRVSLSAHY